MKILVIGGTGLIGGHAALYLVDHGHDVTIAGRKPAAPGSALAKLKQLQGDYVAGTFTRDDLAGYDALVFAAGSDIRHAPQDGDLDAHWQRANVEAIPRFFELARSAGIKQAVLVGSFYPQVAPELIDRIPYVRSRHLSDQGVRALSAPDFKVCSVNAPFVVGAVPGLKVEMFEAYTRYAEGKFAPLPFFGPAGGSNFISTRSLSQAVLGALLHGESGKAYLVGDENLSFADYFKAFLRAVGNDADVPSLDQEHPLLPDMAIYTGRGNTVRYEPDAVESALLGYVRNDIQRAVNEVVAQYRG
ncbi:NAD-dependent epimerase/dehydratase family protein [Pseudomonas sp. JM0905a]|uniref:NAD-dependent epimerase/dehydratase family protein n=1 Tax=Pseudomonas sp. JM0905a TaxID=2772484 RepID=UPI0016869E9C|nr:NAD-dependent epimerase/dehydratase family protein [Pseudomonas sp. JM0905a]MBD2836043.1 NAD-dependent epimerase/dehydratase family protein [Pseudomonas sp. JM0905a]